MNGWIADISLWCFPASLILGAAFALAVWALHHYYPQSRFCRTLAGGKTAIVLLLSTAVAMAIEGTWAIDLHRTYPFIVLVLLLAANLELVVLRHLPQRNIAFLLNHAGLFIILWGGAFGATDTTEARMIIHNGQSSHTAYTLKNEAVPLPFEVQLDRFAIEYYDDGITPRQFRSELQIDGQTYTIEVNAPAHYGGYTIYQESYDRTQNAYTVLLLVRDPWLWVVWLGMAMLAAASLLLILGKR